VTAPRRRRGWKRGAAATTVLAASLVLGKKTFDYAAAPSEAKECDFAYPEESGPALVPIAQAPEDSGVAFAQRGGFINDASCLNRTAIEGIVAVREVADVAAALRLAKRHGWKVSAAGLCHSMGGQSFAHGNLVLDMRGLNDIQIDKQGRTMVVQAGAMWDEVQRRLDRDGLSVIAMQSYNVFTVGGSLSVNAHGIAHDPGAIGGTVKSIHIMTADGTVVKASATENAELFRHAIGGYGLFGIIIDAEIALADNAVYRHDIETIDLQSVPDAAAGVVAAGYDVGLVYGRFSVSPRNFLGEVALHRFVRQPDAAPEPLRADDPYVWLKRLVLNVSKTGRLGRWLRWTMEQDLEPWLQPCLTRNQAMAEPDACLITRNQEMYDGMAYLKNRLADTDILQEYFLPAAQVPAFIAGLRQTIDRTGANLLNVTMRLVQADRVTALPYAPEDRVALVLYFNQSLDTADAGHLETATRNLIDLSNSLDGRFYLPYQLYYSAEQLRAAYPEARAFFAAKRIYDPDGVFTNKLYEKYGQNLQ
jgi:FAD/FMN-containing dehydrogenase